MDYRGRVYGEREKCQKLFGQIIPVDVRVRGAHEHEYSLADVLSIGEHRRELLRIRGAHIRAQKVSGEDRYFLVPS